MTLTTRQKISDHRQHFLETHDYCAGCWKYYPKSDDKYCRECGTQLRKVSRRERGRRWFAADDGQP